MGAGSIGTRHLSVLAGLGAETAVVSSRDQPGRRYATVANAVRDFSPDYAVVATETARHAATVSELAAAGFRGRLLVEKPLAVEPGALTGFSRVGIGFNLRFHPVIARLADLLSTTKIYTVEVYAGQALAGWRPGRAVGDQYSAHRSRGGGVLRDLSHELDYLGWMLGECRGVSAVGGRLANVTVDADDAWGMVAEYDRSPVVTLQLNYLDTRTRRRIVATTSAGTIEADVIAGRVILDTADESIPLDRDASYAAMHRSMLADGAAVATSEDASRTDRLIDLIERSAATRTWMTP